MDNDLNLSGSEALVWENERGPAPVPFLECSRHVPYVLRLSGPLDVAALSASVDALVARHPLLRAVYDPRSGRLVTPAASGVLRCVDLGDLAAEARDAYAQRLVEADANAAIDLSTGPISRALLVRLDPSRHVLAMTTHHIVLDGWSRRVLGRDLHQLYGAATGTAAAPIEPQAGYHDYVSLQREAMSGAALAAHREFWLKQLDDVPDARIPSGASPTRDLQQAPGRETFTISPDSAAALRSIGRDCGATLAMTTLAMFALLVHELTGETEVAVGVPITDRPRSRFERVIGLMMNALTIRSSLSRSPRFRTFVRDIARAFSDAYDHRALPFRDVVRLVRLERGPGVAPFRALLNVVKGQPAGATLPGLDSAAVAVPVHSPSAADLSLHVLDRSAGFECVLVYQPGRLGASAPAICRRFQGLVASVLAEPDAAVSRLCCEPGLPV